MLTRWCQPVSGCQCDLDSVSRCDIVVSLDDMSLSGGGDTVVSGVDESVCGVNSVLAAGVLDRCCVDSLLSDGAGDSSGVEVVDDAVACCDDTLLPGAFPVGGCL